LAEKFSVGRGQKEHKDREIAPISLPLFHQCRVRGCTGHAPRAHLKEMLHQEPCIKSEDLLMEKYPFPENVYFIRKFQPNFLQKTLYPSPHLALKEEGPIGRNSIAKNLEDFSERNAKNFV